MIKHTEHVDMDMYAWSHSQIHVHLRKTKLLEKVIVINIYHWCTYISP